MTNLEGRFNVISLHLIGVTDEIHEESYANSAILARVSTMVYISAFILNRLAKSVTPLTREMLDSNLGQGTKYSNGIFRGFPQSFRANAGIVP
jgi:hypothetical protein